MFVYLSDHSLACSGHKFCIDFTLAHQGKIFREALSAEMNRKKNEVGACRPVWTPGSKTPEHTHSYCLHDAFVWTEAWRFSYRMTWVSSRSLTHSQSAHLTCVLREPWDLGVLYLILGQQNLGSIKMFRTSVTFKGVDYTLIVQILFQPLENC